MLVLSHWHLSVLLISFDILWTKGVIGRVHIIKNWRNQPSLCFANQQNTSLPQQRSRNPKKTSNSTNESQGTQLFFTSHSSVQIEGHILRGYHFLIQWPFLLPWSRSKNCGSTVGVWFQEAATTQPPSVYPICHEPAISEKHTNYRVIFEGQFNSSETNYTCWKVIQTTIQLICWGFIRPGTICPAFGCGWKGGVEPMQHQARMKKRPKCECIKYKVPIRLPIQTKPWGKSLKNTIPISCALFDPLYSFHDSWPHPFTQQLHVWCVQPSSLTTSDFEDTEVMLFSILSSKFTSLNLLML